MLIESYHGVHSGRVRTVRLWEVLKSHVLKLLNINVWWYHIRIIFVDLVIFGPLLCFGPGIWIWWSILQIYWGKLCRCIRMLFCKTSINLQGSVRRCTPDVRTKWISFKFSNFLPWQNLMQVSCNAIVVLSMNVLDLQKQITSYAWWRSDTINSVLSYSNLLWGLFFAMITFCIYLNIRVHGASSHYIEIINFIFHVSVCISLFIVEVGQYSLHIPSWPLFGHTVGLFNIKNGELFQFFMK